VNFFPSSPFASTGAVFSKFRISKVLEGFKSVFAVSAGVNLNKSKGGLVKGKDVRSLNPFLFITEKERKNTRLK